MGIDVTLPTLSSIAPRLTTGGQDVEAMGKNAPEGVDGGDASGIISAIIGDVASAAATAAEGMHNAATAVRTSHDSYSETEQAVGQTMAQHRAGLQRGY